MSLVKLLLIQMKNFKLVKKKLIKIKKEKMIIKFKYDNY
jgi:hypothetical protein